MGSIQSAGKACLLALLFLAPGLSAQAPDVQATVAALQAGGKVIVMRHASSPRDLPDAATASPGNDNLERQLDEKGRSDAAAFGAALRRLGIAISETGSSPTFRAMETARLAGLENIVPHAELGNADMRESGQEKAAWLREQTATAPARGNLLLVTHTPNISAAFPDAGRTSEGEALVFDPQVSNVVPVGRIAIEAWADL